MQLIRDVLAQMETAKVDGVGDTLGDIGEGEKVLGTLPDELQRLYVVMDCTIDKVKEELNALAKAERANPTVKREGKCQCPACNGTTDTINNRVTTVKDLFWGAVRRAIPGAIKGNIGVRKGFRIVARPPEDDEAEVIAMRIPLSEGLAAMLRR